MTTQLLVVPSTVAKLTEENGQASRQFQFFISNLVNNVNAINQVPSKGVILFPTASTPPTGWTKLTGTGSTVTINSVSYTYIQHS